MVPQHRLLIMASLSAAIGLLGMGVPGPLFAIEGASQIAGTITKLEGGSIYRPWGPWARCHAAGDEEYECDLRGWQGKPDVHGARGRNPADAAYAETGSTR